ncbi:MAG TPA: M60 family metallopeptidase, partial [Prosthecobacter sp.]
VLNAQSLTDTEQGARVLEWVKNGGGLIAGMTGWAFSQISGGKDLATSHGLNQALMAAGVAFTDMSAFDQVRAFEGRADLPRLMNASEAVAAIKKQSSGGASLSPADMKQAANAIQVALAAQPPERSNLRDAVMAALGNTASGGHVPTKEAPLTQAQDAPARIRLGMETRMLRLAGGDKAVPHPAHESFPGKAPADAARTKAEVSVVPSIPGWTSTGLYAAAGEPITVTLPAASADKGYAVRIGCHSDTLYHLDSWSRAPDICKSIPLNQSSTTVASAFGGLVYIEVPARAEKDTPFTATVAGAIPAPFFVLGKDDDAKWNQELKNRPAPWAELACDKMIVSLPSEVARRVNNPTQIMEFWKQVVEVQDDISNQTASRKRPERMVADVQISAGFMHSGYPIMLHLPEAQEMVTLNRLKFPGWGFHHEIGHNHQRGDFTFDGTGEVTNNVLGMYVYHSVLKKDWLIGHPAISAEQRKLHIAKIKGAEDKWAVWKSSPFVALTTYIQLVQAFGWESWRAYLYSFANAEFGPAPKSDDEKRDQFLVRYSKITGKNLGPFFDAWGIPVSSQAKASVAHLQPWMPEEM